MKRLTGRSEVMDGLPTLKKAQVRQPRFRLSSELEVPSGGRATKAAIGSGSRQQAHNSSQVFPSRLVQCRVCPDEVADHVPRSNVQSPLRRRSHSQRDRALRAKTNPLRRRFLPRPYTHGLREHIYRNGFVARFELPIAAKTIQVFQRSLGGRLRPGNIVSTLQAGASA
jgi:hypothetical protein